MSAKHGAKKGTTRREDADTAGCGAAGAGAGSGTSSGSPDSVLAGDHHDDHPTRRGLPHESHDRPATSTEAMKELEEKHLTILEAILGNGGSKHTMAEAGLELGIADLAKHWDAADAYSRNVVKQALEAFHRVIRDFPGCMPKLHDAVVLLDTMGLVDTRHNTVVSLTHHLAGAGWTSVSVAMVACFSLYITPKHTPQLKLCLVEAGVPLSDLSDADGCFLWSSALYKLSKKPRVHLLDWCNSLLPNGLWSYKPRRLSHGADLYLERDEAEATISNITAAICHAADEQDRVEQAYPVMVAAGAPGIGKSATLDRLQEVCAPAAMKMGREVLTVTITYGSTTGPCLELEGSYGVDVCVAVRVLYEVFGRAQGSDVSLAEFVRSMIDNGYCPGRLTLAEALQIVLHSYHGMGKDASPEAQYAVWDRACLVLGIDEVQRPVFYIHGDGARRAATHFFIRTPSHAVGAAMAELGSIGIALVSAVAGTRPSLVAVGVCGTGHPTKRLPLPWLSNDGVLQWLGTVQRDADSIAGQLEGTDLLPEALAAVAKATADAAAPGTGENWALWQACCDMSGHPRLLTFFIVSATSLLSDITRARRAKGVLAPDAVASMRLLRVSAVLRKTETAFAKSGSRVTGVPVEHVPRLLALVASQAQVCTNTKLFGDTTVEDLESRGLLVVTKKINRTTWSPWSPAITMPYILFRVMAGRVPPMPESNTATEAFVDSLRLWFELEATRRSPAVLPARLWQAIGVVYRCIRCNSLLVIAGADTLPLSFGKLLPGAIMSWATKSLPVVLHPMRMFRSSVELSPALLGGLLSSDDGLPDPAWCATDQVGRWSVMSPRGDLGVSTFAILDGREKLVLELDRRTCYSATTNNKGSMAALLAKWEKVVGSARVNDGVTMDVTVVSEVFTTSPTTAKWTPGDEHHVVVSRACWPEFFRYFAGRPMLTCLPAAGAGGKGGFKGQTDDGKDEKK